MEQICKQINCSAEKEHLSRADFTAAVTQYLCSNEPKEKAEEGIGDYLKKLDEFDLNEYISRLCSYPLLILDDFGMERGTEYGLEQVYSVIDSRYRSGKPLIATTNLTLEELQHPQDTPHARIYDRLTSMCAPVRFTGSNFRKETAQEKLERLKQLMKQRKESL